MRLDDVRAGRLGGVLAAVGGTPLIELDNLLPGAPFRLYAKLEALNPGGSLKDRPALLMVLDGVRSGAIEPGRTVVVESTSGNLGIGLAQVCRFLGVRLICVVDSRTTEQNIAVLRAFGAEVDVVTEVDAQSGHYQAARIRRVQEIVELLPDAYWPNQYANPLNAQAHQATMREIVDGMPAGIDYLFCATSSCGTLRGCTEYARARQLPLTVVAVDAEGSVIFGGQPGQRLIPGHGAAVRPDLFGPDLADVVVHVSDLDCVVSCRRLVAREAILAGGSAGAVVAAVQRMQHEIPPGARAVLILPDRGERYLDTIYDDAWVTGRFGDCSHLWREPVLAGTPC